MARTPLQQGEDARRFDAALKGAEADRTEQERNVALWGTALIFTGADGRVTQLEDAALKARAQKLLGALRSENMGMGSFNLYVPRPVLEQEGFSLQTWEKAEAAGLLKTVTFSGVPHFEIDYTTAVTEFLPRLENVAGTSWQATHSSAADRLRDQFNSTDQGHKL